MATLGKQVQGGLKKAGQAVTVDVVKGVGEAGRQVVEDTLSTGVEKLSGGVVSPPRLAKVSRHEAGGNQQQKQQGEGADPEFAAVKVQKEKARRRRLQEVQGELQQVVRENQAEREQVAQVEERQQEQQQAQEEESKAARVKKWIMQKAKRGGGTGEMARQKH